ncbi:hypothetical protein GCK72_005168 [Caenorhabditis remanei]|uniref:LIM zinc-binding domain-containing protein n=1 Tax=Caenorhabditis remanei TaxID=31234 RepID=A0A6A5HEI5_CAERE|nr:hypothetical protein GCK72_005168 [Caenorhabditis remanei]KAF1765216.1 hypothetical protein GCK72_005168 [Caenorhabditis remanei]
MKATVIQVHFLRKKPFVIILQAQKEKEEAELVYPTAYGKPRKKGSGKKEKNRRTSSKRKEKESDEVERYESEFEEENIQSDEEMTDISNNAPSSSNSQTRQSLVSSLAGDEGACSSNPRGENWQSRNDEELYHKNPEPNLMDQQHQNPPQPVSVAEDKIIDGALMEAHGRNDQVVSSDRRQCEQCHKSLESEALVTMNRLQAADNHVYCLQCFVQKNNPKCAGCMATLVVGKLLLALDRFWHPHCFTCSSCKRPLPNLEFYLMDDKPYDSDCYRVKCREKREHIKKGER